ncbi:MAG: hypothetical protein KGH64_06145 [Candidatus Micrarchaeota archaeon]|nr:hypothetical protein [Candidatus Micrarchaeota archaeon]
MFASTYEACERFYFSSNGPFLIKKCDQPLALSTEDYYHDLRIMYRYAEHYLGNSITVARKWQIAANAMSYVNSSTRDSIVGEAEELLNISAERKRKTNEARRTRLAAIKSIKNLGCASKTFEGTTIYPPYSNKFSVYLYLCSDEQRTLVAHFMTEKFGAHRIDITPKQLLRTLKQWYPTERVSYAG